jgi:predicted nuclease of restriction endonuclease-like (RecB) superfamily
MLRGVAPWCHNSIFRQEIVGRHISPSLRESRDEMDCTRDSMTPRVSRQALYERVRAILESARANVARSVNTAQVIANWMIGREIVEEQQLGSGRAAYGAELLQKLADKLSKEFGGGYSVDNLELFRRFYLEFPQLVAHKKSDALRRKSAGHSPSRIATGTSARARQIGLLNPNLSWTHYRVLLRISSVDARAFYEIEAAQHHWSARRYKLHLPSEKDLRAQIQDRRERLSTA